MYISEQFRSNTAGGIGNYISDSPDDYISEIKDGTISKVSINTSSVGGEQGGTISFEDTCIILNNTRLTSDKTYYLNCKFKTMVDSEQTFYLVLLDSSGINEQQFIESFTIKRGNSDFIDMSFIFQPFTGYDTICFELIRQWQDYNIPRVPVIVFNELSEIKNIIKTKNLGNKSEFLKIGIQSRPYVDMAINGEGIKMGKTGIYELREDDIKITSFSLFKRAENTLTEEEFATGKKKEEDLFINTKESICLFSHEKEREIIDFSLDYIYEK